MKKKFVNSKIEIVEIVAEDIIALSGDDEGGTVTPPMPFSIDDRDTFDVK